MGRASQFFNELQRRNVVRAGVAYLVLAWLVVQLADILSDTFEAPSWVMRFIVFALVAGFPLTLVLAWVYEITTSGVKRTEEVVLEESITYVTGRKIDFIIIGFLISALGISLYANLRSDPDPLSMPSPISVLIADFQNNTKNELFNGVIEDTLRIGIEVAPFVDAYSRSTARRIAASIAPDTVESPSLSTEVASLVAIQQGIDLVVSGSINDDRDIITVQIVGSYPLERSKSFELSATAPDENEILSAIADLARNLRSEIGQGRSGIDSGQSETFTAMNLEAASEYVLAQNLGMNERLEEAIQHYDRAIQLDPDFTRAYSGRAVAQTQIGRSQLATEDWKAVIRGLDKLTERERLRTLGVYYAVVTRDFDKSHQTFQRLVDRFPADSVALANLSVSSFYNLEFENALADGRLVVERYPNVERSKSNLALFAMYAGHFEEANELAQELIRQSPQARDGWTVAALAAAVAGNLQQTESLYLEMKESSDGGRSIAYEGLADLAIYEGDYSAAVEILNEGIASDIERQALDNAATKYMMLADSQMMLGDRDAALMTIERGLENASSDHAVVSAAMLLVELAELEKAETIASDISTNISRISRAYSETIKARIALARKEPIRAIEHGNSAINVADLWLTRFNRGIVYLELGYIVEAYDEFQICSERIGEGIAVFLDDRPTYTMIGRLNLAIERTAELMKTSKE